ncbi:Hypothetical predicted protein [Pelobates cultripes]|uniref:Integrase SAM-like N-terminal domain-containing protein n=1 Tax=Pelobates cultripes TaxID=61616 RepID=A0AAD1R452_PELCU|nr:Hypothetical predicted protein [Pelobates cultripes]
MGESQDPHAVAEEPMPDVAHQETEDPCSQALAQGKIELVDLSISGWISPLFPIPKSDGTWRPVLNVQGELVECFPKEEKVQDGRFNGPPRPSVKCLLRKIRPQRGFPFSSYRYETQALSQIPLERTDISLDCNGVWPIQRTLHIFQDNESYYIPRQAKRISMPLLLSRQIYKFVTRTWAKRAWKMDEMSFQWTDIPGLYAFPPPSILMKVLEKLRRDRVTNLVLVYPIWTSRPWYPLIQPLIRRQKVPLGWTADCFLGTRDLLTKLPTLMWMAALSDWVLDIVNSSLWCRTRVRYKQMIEEFKAWEISFNSLSNESDTIPLALEFLTLKYHSGLADSTIKTYGSALNFLIHNLTQDALYLRLLKGLSVCRPFFFQDTLPLGMWTFLLNYLNSLDNDQIDLKWTVIKLASLLALALAARGSELTQLNIVEPWLSRTPGGFHVILKGRQKTSHIFPGPVELDLVQDSAERVYA